MNQSRALTQSCIYVQGNSCLMATPLIQPPCYYRHFLAWKKKLSQLFSYLDNPFNTINLLLQPDFCGPLVTGLTGFYCNSSWFDLHLTTYTTSMWIFHKWNICLKFLAGTTTGGTVLRILQEQTQIWLVSSEIYRLLLPRLQGETGSQTATSRLPYQACSENN